jgi:ribokinase
MSNVYKPIVIVGSINLDFVSTASRIPIVGETITGDDFQLHYGGKGANQAVAIARLGYPVEMIGMVGSDSFGPQVRSGLKAAGVGVDAVKAVDGSSGVASITVSHSGENAIVVVPGANAHVTPEYLEQHKDLVRNAGAVLTQLEIPMETVASLAEMCESCGVPLILDPAPAKTIDARLLSRVGWFTPNETEADFFAAAINPGLLGSPPDVVAKAFIMAGASAVVMKLGARGVLLLNGSEAELIPAPRVTVVDTTAAGDAFNGAFATGLMLGMPPREAARFACVAAAISVTKSGAQPSMPSRAEIEEFLRNEATLL